jgi:hypothetical protein
VWTHIARERALMCGLPLQGVNTQYVLVFPWRGSVCLWEGQCGRVYRRICVGVFTGGVCGFFTGESVGEGLCGCIYREDLVGVSMGGSCCCGCVHGEGLWVNWLYDHHLHCTSFVEGRCGCDSCRYPHHLNVPSMFWVGCVKFGPHSVNADGVSPRVLRGLGWRWLPFHSMFGVDCTSFFGLGSPLPFVLVVALPCTVQSKLANILSHKEYYGGKHRK